MILLSNGKLVYQLTVPESDEDAVWHGDRWRAWRVDALRFSRPRWTRPKAKKWAKKHRFIGEATLHPESVMVVKTRGVREGGQWFDIGDGVSAKGHASVKNPVRPSWADKPSRRKSGAPAGKLTRMGALHAVTYNAEHADHGRSDWRHQFGEANPPELAFDESGKLWVLGGQYRVTDEGIVG